MPDQTDCSTAPSCDDASPAPDVPAVDGAAAPGPVAVAPSKSGVWGLVAILALVAGVYAGSFGVPFIFDDFTIITNNRFMRSLWPPTTAMEAPHRSTAAGRPLVSYSFAINYAVSGLNVWSYHVFNLLMHGINVVLVYLLVRHIQAGAAVRRQTADVLGHPGWAMLVAALWAVHPLNSETVVYVAQRTELMMAAFFLAALVMLPRAGRGGHGPVFSLLTVVSGVLAVLCKETAAVLPVLLLLFDRAFVAGSFRAAWRARAGVYLGGIAVIAIAAVIASGGHRGGLVTDDADVTWRYLLTQGGVILHYLRLCAVPYPLAITYEWPLVDGLRDGWLPAAVVGLGLVLTVWALVRRPMLGFLGAAFYLLLAPTSSIIPIMSEVAGERRMYLPLLAVMGLAIAAAAALLRCWTGANPVRRHQAVAAGAGFAMAAIFAASAVTVARVQDFRTTESIWRQTLRAQPDSLYARSNLASELIAQGQLDEAEELLLEKRLAAPHAPQLKAQLGLLAFRRGNYDKAADLFLAQAHTIHGKPKDYAYAGYALMKLGRTKAGQHALGKALSIDPDDPQALNFVAALLSIAGRYHEAIDYNQRILSVYPEMSQVWANQGHNLFQIGDIDAARAAYREAFRLDDTHLGVTRNFANFEARNENYPAAIKLYRRLLELSPHALPVLKNYALLLVEAQDDAAAGEAFHRLITLHPRDLDARQRFALWLTHTDQVHEATRQLQAARKLDPDNARTAEIAQTLTERRAHDPDDASAPRPTAAPAPAPEFSTSGELSR